MTNVTRFGYRLKELREERGLTMEELAEELNKHYPHLLLSKSSKSVISRYESNKTMPKNFSTIEALADYFGVNIAYLMGKSDNRFEEKAKYNIVPIIGNIAAGTPILAQENIEGYEYLPENEKADFCLRVKGDSMIGARILNDNLVFVRKQPDVENGEIAAVLIDDEATLKRVYKVNGNVILHAENPNYPDRIFSKKDMKDVKILGKAVAFKSEVR